MKKKWEKLSRLQKVLLAVMGVMILGFGAATIFVSTQTGMTYQGTLLVLKEEDGTRCYTGRWDGKRIQFTVTPDRTVDCRWGDETYGPYQVVDDPTASPPADGENYHFSDKLPGIEIRQGDEVIFRGGYVNRMNMYMELLKEDGDWEESMVDILFSAGSKVYNAEGRELGDRELHQPSLSSIVRVAMGPELTHRGNFGLYLLVTLLAVFNIFQICCPDLMFRWSIMWHVSNPDAAEPSEWYLFSARASWIVLAGVVAWLYWMVLTIID